MRHIENNLQNSVNNTGKATMSISTLNVDELSNQIKGRLCQVGLKKNQDPIVHSLNENTWIEISTLQS